MTTIKTITTTESTFFVNYFSKKHADNSNFALLKLCVSAQLRNLYQQHIDKHNHAMDTDLYPNAGFDLFVPQTHIFPEQLFLTNMIDHQIKCEMLYCDVKHLNEIENCGFLLYPRSSISKTPLMLANHTGVIDAGYRGNIIGAFRSFGPNYRVEAETKLLQICHPSLCKIYVIMVEENELSITTRGDGGFGSTGL